MHSAHHFRIAFAVSHDTGGAALLSSLPSADGLLADPGYDADWFMEALKDKGIRPYRTEILFGRLKDCRRVATRDDSCPKVFLSAVALAATVMFWL